MARGYVQPITKKQALSYERLIPNGIGVTTLAAVNGRGAAARHERAQSAAGYAEQYRRRYAAAHNALHGYAPNGPDGEAEKVGGTYTVKPNKRSRKMAAKKKRKQTAAQKRASKANLAKARSARRSSAKRAAPAAAKRTRRSKKRSAAAPKERSWKTVKAGKKSYRLLEPVVGGKRRKTYLYKDKRGKVHELHGPKLLGFPSAKALDDFLNSSDPKLAKKQERVRKQALAAGAARRAAAERVEAHGDIFTPNAMSYAEWSKSMTPNKKKKKAKKAAAKKAVAKTTRRRKAKRTAKQIAAARKNIKKAQKAVRAKKAAKKSSKRVSKKSVRRSAAKRRSSTKHKHGGKKDLLVLRFQANKRRRRHYRHNPAMQGIKDVLMTGLAVGAGFATHRALRQVIDTYALGKIDALSGAKDAAKYRPMISSAVTALIGVGALQFAKGKASPAAQKAITEAQGGMVASVVLDVVTKALGMSTSTAKAVPYLSGFGEYVPMSGLGEYVPMSGLGSYYSMSGLGQLDQAAAGFGAISQAAAGMGAISQAAAGFGMMSQAAAGVPLSEYFPPSPTGTRDYLTRNVPISGFGESEIEPTLSAAEQALTVAESVAGLGVADLHMPVSSAKANKFILGAGTPTKPVQIVDAWQVAQPITDDDSAQSRNYGVLSPFVDDALQDPDEIHDFAEAHSMRQGVLAGGSFG